MRLGLSRETSSTGLLFGVRTNHVNVINGALCPTPRSLSPISWSVETASTSTHQTYNLLLLPSCYKERHTSVSVNASLPYPSIPNLSCLWREQNPLYWIFSLPHLFLTWLSSTSIESTADAPILRSKHQTKTLLNILSLPICHSVSIQPNAEFQRIARRGKKAFLSEQCKKIEENNIMGTTRDLFKKIIETKGTFHAKMGTIKDRNGIDLTEAEEIKKRWQEYSEEQYKMVLTTWIATMVWMLT